jgi:hypothetical protein
MPKRMLLMRASKDVCADEIVNITSICDMFGIEHVTVNLDNLDKFVSDVATKGHFDFLYLGAHADLFGFGEADSSTAFSWPDFAVSLCVSDCLNYGSILMLGCCRGGLRAVAMQLFLSCGKIDYVVGPRWTVTAQEITTGFHIFLYNMVCRKEQPSTATKRASKGTGYDFYYYDRVEAEDLFYSKHYEEQYQDGLENPALNSAPPDPPEPP